MISIIISSYQPKFYDALEKNIEETIGIPYEIIKIENPGIMGICEAYNKGAEKAKFDYLLFLHEDVEFVTQDWGQKLISHLQQEQTGCIGVAGSTYLPNVPFAWWDNFEDTLCNIIQCNKGVVLRDYTLDKKTLATTLDGVFIACRRDVFNAFKFSRHINGFHAYDLDFSARVGSKYNNFVINDIKLKHFSEGNPNVSWWEEIISARKLYHKPNNQKINKKKELIYYLLFKKRLTKFNTPNKRKLLLAFNNPKFVGYKASMHNLIKIFNGK